MLTFANSHEMLALCCTEDTCENMLTSANEKYRALSTPDTLAFKNLIDFSILHKCNSKSRFQSYNL